MSLDSATPSLIELLPSPQNGRSLFQTQRSSGPSIVMASTSWTYAILNLTWFLWPASPVPNPSVSLYEGGHALGAPFHWKCWWHVHMDVTKSFSKKNYHLYIWQWGITKPLSLFSCHLSCHKNVQITSSGPHGMFPNFPLSYRVKMVYGCLCNHGK